MYSQDVDKSKKLESLETEILEQAKDSDSSISVTKMKLKVH